DPACGSRKFLEDRRRRLTRGGSRPRPSPLTPFAIREAGSGLRDDVLWGLSDLRSSHRLLQQRNLPAVVHRVLGYALKEVVKIILAAWNSGGETLNLETSNGLRQFQVAGKE